MPTVLRYGAYRFFFYASDGQEPAHVHVERDDEVAKFWLNPVKLHSGGKMKPVDLAAIAKIIIGHRAALLEAWNEYFHG
jgi:hypothetical protein